jgi:hypothetical protein
MAICTKSQTCASGVCTPCAAGTGDCDGTATNACETNTNTSAANCGACGTVCSVGTCTSGACYIQFPYTPTNFDPAGLDAASTDDTTLLNCGVSTFDSTTMTFGNWCGQNLPSPVTRTQPSGPSVVVVPVRNLTLAAGNTIKVTGGSPVIFAVFGNATIAGIVDASASGTTPGAGGNVSCGTSQGGNGSGSTARNSGASGGGGGGFGTVGGKGGLCNTDGCCGGTTPRNTPGGSGGVTRGTSSESPLLGGCAGGMAGDCSTAGGAGGGAVQISVAGTLTVSGSVRADGAPGALPCGASDEGGGTGGGSGGGILLEGQTLNTTGSTLRANGGAGGPDGGYFHCSAGPTGSTSSSNPGSDGQNCSGGSPGGGGGYGRIQTLDR